MTDHRPIPHLLAVLLLALASPAPLHPPVAAAPSQVPAKAASPPTLLQRLRQLIGYNPSQAVGGSRSGSAARVCLISPPVQPQRDGSLLATVASPAPVLVTTEPLLELRIERRDTIAWQQRASSSEPIRGPIAWPLQPLEPGEEVRLRLRPRGSAGADFAEISLRAAPRAAQQQALAVLQRPDRLAVIENLVAEGQGRLAAELVFAPSPAAQPMPPAELESLRAALQVQGCGGSGS